MSDIPYREEFLDDQRVKWSKSTFQNRQSGLEKFEEWLEEKDYDVSGVGSFELNNYFKWLIKDSGAGLSELSAYNYLTAVRKYFDFIPVRDDDDNPAREIDTSWLDYEVENDKPRLDEDELRALVESAESMRGKALLSLMASTGMRLQEAVSVSMRQLDLGDRMVEDLETVKTDFGERTVFFDRRTRRILKKYIEEGYRGKYPSDSDYLFVSDGERGEHMSTDRGRVEFIRAVDNCDEIEDKVWYNEMADGRERCSVGTHILRRSFCQIWVDSGGDIMTLRNFVGWETLETARSYLDSSVDREKRDNFGVRL